MKSNRPPSRNPTRTLTMVKALLLSLVLTLAGCNALPGLNLGAGQTLKGKVLGTGLGSNTRVAVMAGLFLPSDLIRAQVVSVSSDGSWAYSIPSGPDNLTIFAFQDKNGNGTVDTGEPNSFEVSKCPDCSYLYASLIGDSWKVLVKRSGASSEATLAGANIQFSAT